MLQPTLEYRLAFLLNLLIMALVPLGTSIISLGPWWVARHKDLQIANLTMTKGLSSAPQHQCFAKADEIVNLELVEGGTYGYETQTKRTLVPWPKPGLEASDGIFKYESDVAAHNYTCRWPKFKLNKPEGSVVITEMNTISWTPWNDISIQVFYIFGVFHL